LPLPALGGGGGYILKDTGSTNGIKLDTERMEIIDLANGQEIQVGDAGMEFELTKDEKEELAKEEHKPQGRAQLPKAKKKHDDDPASDAKSRTASSRRPTPAPTGLHRPGVASPLVSAQTNTAAATSAITPGLHALAILAFHAGHNSGHNSKYPRNQPPNSTGLWGDMFANEPTLEKKEKKD
jgi:predicted component of type VI protein secretion system